ncbi:MAG: SDR family NAD(P)-dependent oxidoreductase [Clostridiales bacterium]|nr:SDR family NAD(P)-dependent oxidoreductase [Clostridiales bacterium]
MRNIVIVGGSSGIGLALIQNLEGDNIVNISRTPCTVAGVNNLTADVTDTQSLKRAFSRISRIDALIYCAGTSMAAPVEYVRTDDYKHLFEVNIFGAIECCKLAAPLLKKSEDGRIIMLSSTGGITPIAYDGFYSATKAGLIALCTELRLELPQIKSTAVIIGGTRTQFSFKRDVYINCDDYDEDLKRATAALTKIEQTGYDADFVAKKIVAILDKNNPPPQVTIGLKNKLLTGLYKLMPWQLKLSSLRSTYDI